MNLYLSQGAIKLILRISKHVHSQIPNHLRAQFQNVVVLSLLRMNLRKVEPLFWRRIFTGPKELNDLKIRREVFMTAYQYWINTNIFAQMYYQRIICHIVANWHYKIVFFAFWKNWVPVYYSFWFDYCSSAIFWSKVFSFLHYFKLL